MKKDSKISEEYIEVHYVILEWPKIIYTNTYNILFGVEMNKKINELSDKCKDGKEHKWSNMAPNNHMTCSKCGKVKW